MSKSYRPYDPDQQLLLPAALQQWLPDDHLAYFISDVVDQLDLSEITARYERESRGGPPYHPRMMVKVLLYGYCVGVASSRRIAQRLHEDIAFRVLAANNTPDFRTISDFRKDNLGALSGLFVQVLALCRQAGLVKLGHVALDGTKVRANASKHKAMSYGRMKEKEAQLSTEVDELLRRADEVDEEEDRRYGADKRGDELPQELSFREGRLEKIREAMAALEVEAEAAAEQAEAEGKDHSGVPDDRERRFTVRSTDVPAGPMRCDMTTPNTTGFRLPDPPERGADEFTRARHLFMTGSAHHLARHLGRPDTTLVSAELYITHVPRSRQDGRIPGPDLLVAFDVDPEIY